jgi:uncharacterized protein (TIGR02391 family)
MDSGNLARFERITRRAHLFSDEEIRLDSVDHPFDTRNIHPNLPPIVRSLFDDGYYTQATFEAFKYLDRQVARIAKSSLTGRKLMMNTFKDQSPAIQLTSLITDSEKDEQEGYRFIFAGSIMAVRNPRGHEYYLKDSIDDCLDYLSLASLLLRRIEKAGYRLLS